MMMTMMRYVEYVEYGENDENLRLIQLMEGLGKQVDGVKYKSCLRLKISFLWFLIMMSHYDFL